MHGLRTDIIVQGDGIAAILLVLGRLGNEEHLGTVVRVGANLPHSGKKPH